MTDLTGRVVLITGGGGGLGRAIARRASVLGASVAINYKQSQAAAHAYVETLTGLGGRAAAFKADVSDWAATKDLIDQVSAWAGPVEILVNNAGVTRAIAHTRLDLITREDWTSILDVNLLGAFACSQAMASQVGIEGGSILNIASDSAFTGRGSSIPYVVSKAALVSLTTTLALALAPAIRVNAVAPGWMATPWLDRYLPTEDVAAVHREGVLDPDDVAALAIDLILDPTRSGETIVIQPPDPNADVFKTHG